MSVCCLVMSEVKDDGVVELLFDWWIVSDCVVFFCIFCSIWIVYVFWG